MTALAAGANTVTTTGAFSFTVSADGTIDIECQGSGAGGFNPHAGGGGAEATTLSLTVHAGDTVYGYCPPGGANTVNGQDAWANVNVNAPPTSETTGCLAKGGSTGTSTTAGAGGQASSCIGDTAFNGGNGG